MKTGHIVLDSLVATIRAQKTLAEKAIAQVPDDRLHTPLHGETNSIAVIMKHMGGNMLSRFTEFLTTDGEKHWRERDNEFTDDNADRAEILRRWEEAWSCLFRAVERLTDADLARTVHIRGEAHSVPLALHRALAHQAYHVGQIVQVSRILAGPNWTTLTVPRGGSHQFNLDKGFDAGLAR